MARKLEQIKKPKLLKQQQALLNLRKKLKMSQKEFAYQLNVTPGAVGSWETGLNKVPGPISRLIEIYSILLENNSLNLVLRNTEFQ